MWLPALVAAGLFLVGVTRVPGLHGDEAWVLLRVRELEAGARPWDGMNFYTGALHQYLVWPFVRLLGETPLALRLPGALASVAAVAALAAALRRLAGERTALWAGLLVATAPAVVSHARFAIEVTALTPMLAGVALLAFAACWGHSKAGLRGGALGLLGGLCLGVAAHGHLVALPLPLAAGLAMVLFYGHRLWRRPELYAGVLGFLIGFAPRVREIHKLGGLAFLRGRQGPSFWPDLPHLPAALLEAWDGRAIYQRFTGDPAGAWPYPLLALAVIVLLGPAVGQRPRWRHGFAAVVLGFVALAFATTAISPHLAVRYFVGAFWTLPILLALAARPLLEHGGHARAAAAAVLGFVVVANLGYLGHGYFVPFVLRGGGLSTFKVGTRLTETSDHFVRTDGLYRALRNQGVHRVFGNFFIAKPLRVADRNHFIEIHEWGGHLPPGRDRVTADTAAIFYDHGAADTITHDGLQWRRDRSFPPPLLAVYRPILP